MRYGHLKFRTNVQEIVAWAYKEALFLAILQLKMNFKAQKYLKYQNL